MRRAWRNLFIGVLIGTAIAGLVWYFPQHEPVARMTLADGTELRVEYVTYGTEHRVPGAGQFKAWASRQAQRWPRLGISIYEAEYRHQTEEPELILWVTHFNPKTREFDG